MNYHQEWADETDELSEFDLANSADPPDEKDPEAAVSESEGTATDEADPADVADQLIEIPLDDEEPHAR